MDSAADSQRVDTESLTQHPFPSASHVSGSTGKRQGRVSAYRTVSRCLRRIGFQITPRYTSLLL